MGLYKGNKSRLGPRQLEFFRGSTIFDRIARAVCVAHCLPRKELYESWEMARRVRRFFRGGRVVDLAAGHGVLALIMLILDDTSPRALVVDAKTPPSAARIEEAFLSEWPRLRGRVERIAADLEAPLPMPLLSTDLVVSAHACGALTDRALAMATDARARVAVLPCCHDAARCDSGSLSGWLEPSLAIDVVRATRLEKAGYRVRTIKLPEEITPKNRLLLGEAIVDGRLHGEPGHENTA